MVLVRKDTMSYEYVKTIPSPKEIMEILPISEEIRNTKKERDQIIKKIFTNEDDRFLLIIGPCSADREDAVCDYVNRIKGIQEKVKDKIVIVPRVYTNKPRTTGEGYKGMVHQPNPSKGSNMYQGILAMRHMHIRVIRESGLTCADEMLYPENYAYLEDLLSYVAIGARSVENQQHRLTVSGIDVPAGMKNPTGGDMSIMLNAIKAAQLKHTMIYRNWEVKTSGNPLTHAIMRGSVNQYGQSIPNYHYEDIVRLMEQYGQRDLKNPTIIIDTNHSNSNKQPKQQPRIGMEVIKNRSLNSSIKRYVKGLMIESYIVEGRQEVGGGVYGKSITDACLSWEQTERMIYEMADKL